MANIIWEISIHILNGHNVPKIKIKTYHVSRFSRENGQMGKWYIMYYFLSDHFLATHYSMLGCGKSWNCVQYIINLELKWGVMSEGTSKKDDRTKGGGVGHKRTRRGRERSFRNKCGLGKMCDLEEFSAELHKQLFGDNLGCEWLEFFAICMKFGGPVKHFMARSQKVWVINKSAFQSLQTLYQYNFILIGVKN